MIAREEDIKQCSFAAWYGLLPQGKTFKSRVIHLSPNFVDYLHEDGVQLPKGSRHYFSSDVLSDDEDDKLEEVHHTDSTATPDFSALDAAISQAITELGGDVMVKLNWSCPLDAVWMNAGSLKCKRAIKCI